MTRSCLQLVKDEVIACGELDISASSLLIVLLQLFPPPPLIIPVRSDRLLEGRLHEFDLPMLPVSKSSASAAAPPPVGNSPRSLFFRGFF